MEIKIDIVNFLKENFSPDKYQYYVDVLTETGEEDFGSALKADPSTELFVKTEKICLLGILDDSDVILLFLYYKIKDTVKICAQSIPDSVISIFASDDQIIAARTKYKDKDDEFKGARKDLEKVTNELYRRIEENFWQDLEHFLDTNGIPKFRATLESLENGYRFIFSERNVYVEDPLF